VRAPGAVKGRARTRSASGGPEVLHEWAIGADPADAEAVAASVDRLGALIAGRRTYDASLRWWGADGPTGPRRLPLFVVTHRVPDDVPTDGVYRPRPVGDPPAVPHRPLSRLGPAP